MAIEGRNFANREIEVPRDGHFIRCNLSRGEPHTLILSDDLLLILEQCNLTNCDLPDGATVTSCLQGHQHYVTPRDPEHESSDDDLDSVWEDKRGVIACRFVGGEAIIVSEKKLAELGLDSTKRYRREDIENG